VPLPHVAKAPVPVAADASGSTVLVVEDDASHRRILSESLRAVGYRVEPAASASAVSDVLRDVVPDVVLLDLGLPDADGLVLCRRLAAWPAVPILVVSADHDEQRIVDALDAGAGDYLTKPYSLPVLLARLRVAQRGPVPNGATSHQPWSVGDLRLDPTEHQAWAAGSPIALRAREFAALELLMRNPDQLVPYSALTGRPRGANVPANELNALRIVVSRVRAAIGVGPQRPTIGTEARFGYRLVRPVD
jgi:two-component system, OmpR family, KDP operon response regulator KdpE